MSEKDYISFAQAEAFGKLIRDARLALGKTQEEVARECGLSQTFVSSSERFSPASGTRFLKMLILLRYYRIRPNKAVRVLGLSADWFSPVENELYVIIEQMSEPQIQGLLSYAKFLMQQ
jgi:transcriptional regulator with XRE-family HTH domain